MSYWPNLGSMMTRLLNALFGGNRRGESVSSALARKAAQGRYFFIVAEALNDLMFAIFKRERHHSENNREP